MFKFCNECFLCNKYYNEDAENKNTYGDEWAKRNLTPFINNDYEINISNEKLTEEYMFTASDKGLPRWYFYEDEFIYSCSGSILKGIEGSTSSWNGCSDNTNLTSYFITNYGKLIYIDLTHYRKKEIYLKYPAQGGRGDYTGYSPIKRTDTILNKTKINQETLNNINMLYERPGLFTTTDANQKFNIEIIYSVIHTYKSSNLINNEDKFNEAIQYLELLKNEYGDLDDKYNKLKGNYNDLFNLYQDNLNDLKRISNTRISPPPQPKQESPSSIAAHNRELLLNRKTRLKNKIKGKKDTTNNGNNMFLNPGTWN